LPHLTGEVLDFGCGLGNLAVAAAERGCRIHALDGSPVAIGHLRERATAARLPLQAEVADLRCYALTRPYDAVVCIGLLMFFDCATARRVLDELQSHLRPGGILTLNVLIEGTTWTCSIRPATACSTRWRSKEQLRPGRRFTPNAPNFPRRASR
jgi:tellurite methyltransferase